MSYQDFLPHTPYESLPEDVKGSIDRNAYEELRFAAQAVNDPPPLPSALGVAFRKRTAVSGPAIASVGGLRWSWPAAAGWLLFLMAVGYIGSLPRSKPVYRLISAPVPAPEIRYLRDTVFLTNVREVAVIVRDTVYVSVSTDALAANDSLEAGGGGDTIRSRSLAETGGWISPVGQVGPLE